jgi:DinB superfamily
MWPHTRTMESVWSSSLGRRYDAAIDALERVLRDCPDDLWEEGLWTVRRTDPWMWPTGGSGSRTERAIQVFASFWYAAYHCLFYLDFYLSAGPEGFAMPAPFGGVAEHGIGPDGAATLPYRVYTRAELLDYLAHGRRKARAVTGALTDEEAAQPCPPGSPHTGKPFAELLLINLTHVVEHSAQLAGFLGWRRQRSR